MTLVLGLTGGIASGKSTISRHFIKKNIPVIDADRIARKVMEPNQLTFKEVVKVFGEDILTENNVLNRKKLGEIVFTNPDKLNQLNRIVHGAIYDWIVQEKTRYIEKNVPLLVLDIPLLLEVGYEKEVDEIMVVYTNYDTQLKRLMKRDNLNENEAKARIQAQLSLDEKVKKADVVIDNNGTIEKSIEQLDAWLKVKGY